MADITITLSDQDCKNYASFYGWPETIVEVSTDEDGEPTTVIVNNPQSCDDFMRGMLVEQIQNALLEKRKRDVAAALDAQPLPEVTTN